MKKYSGTCHCGKVLFAFNSEEIKTGLRCTCSICKRLGVVHSPRLINENIVILTGKDFLKEYIHGDREIKFMFCGNCGIYTFYDPVNKPGQSRVNLGCVDEIDIYDLEITVFDGKNLL